MKIKGNRTIATGIGAIFSAAGAYFSGQIELAAALQLAVTGFIGIFLRMGMK